MEERNYIAMGGNVRVRKKNEWQEPRGKNVIVLPKLNVSVRQ